MHSVLGLTEKKVPELGLNIAQRGTIYHRILEDVYQLAGTNSDLEGIFALLADCAERFFLDAPTTIGFRESPLWIVEKAQILEIPHKTIEKLEKFRADWTPVYFEQKFGIAGKPALSLDLGSEKIFIRGAIDRVDRNSSGEIRVIDYKSGGSNLSKSDLKNGNRLQISIYAKAAQNALHLGTTTEGFYWVINSAKPSSIKLSKAKHEDLTGPQAAYVYLLESLERTVPGVRAGEFPPKVPKGGCPSYCPAASWCWRYQPGFRVR